MEKKKEDQKVMKLLEREGINVKEFQKEKKALMERKSELQARMGLAGVTLPGPSAEVE